MRVVFVRHGERGAGALDPALTAAGRRMSHETGEWLATMQVSPLMALCTRTIRTVQTLDEILAVIGPTHVELRQDLPESQDDWDALVDPLRSALGDASTLLLVGHHPTLHFLADAFGPPPLPVPRHHFAAALILRPVRARWAIEAAWPGRAG